MPGPAGHSPYVPGSKAQLECTNPSAFNVSLQDVRLTPPGNNEENLQSGMCPAKGRALFDVPDTTQLRGGTAIGPSMSVTGSGMGIVSCLFNIRGFDGYVSSGLVESDYPGIYKTNVDGIGIKGSFINTVGQTRGLSYTSGVNVGGVTMNGATAQLYVIGPVNPTDANNKVQISNLQVGFWVKDSNTPGGVRWGTLTINITTGVLNVLSCKTPNVTVPLGKHSASDFATVGATSAPVAFNIWPR